MKKFISNLFNSEKKLFYTFLIVHLIVWTCIGLIRTVMPTDALEGIYWGGLHDFGTPKHPPLAGWLSYLTYAPFHKDFCIYFVSQLFIILGFVYIYRLAKCFLDEQKSMLSVILLEGCWVYSYITGYYGFNPDVIMLFTLPAISFYFYKCISQDKPLNWIKLGLIVGFAFLNKYQTGSLILAMFVWACCFKRDIFKNKYFYISIFIAFFMFLPHLLWLIRYDFFPMLYFKEELTDTTWISHIIAPLKFIGVQLGLIAGSLLIFILLKLHTKTPLTLRKEFDKKELWFLLLLGLIPILMHVFMGVWAGGTMRGRWGFELWYMLGIMLFYFIPLDIKHKDFVFALKSAYIVMFIIFLSLGTLLSIEKNYRSRYPYNKIINDLNQIWQAKYGTNVKYLGGYIEWTLPLTIYNKEHPQIILDTFGYKNPWIDEEDLKHTGILIIDRTIEKIEFYTHLSCPYLPDDYKIEPVNYSVTVKNAIGQPRTYNIYYLIIPPMK